MKAIFLFLLPLFFVSCTKKEFNFSKEVTLLLEQPVAISNDLTLVYAKEIENSICPKNTQCFWAGQAIIDLKVNDKDMVTIGLNVTKPVDSDIKESLTYEDYTFKFITINDALATKEKYIKVLVEKD